MNAAGALDGVGKDIDVNAHEAEDELEVQNKAVASGAVEQLLSDLNALLAQPVDLSVVNAGELVAAVVDSLHDIGHGSLAEHELEDLGVEGLRADGEAVNAVSRHDLKALHAVLADEGDLVDVEVELGDGGAVDPVGKELHQSFKEVGVHVRRSAAAEKDSSRLDLVNAEHLHVVVHLHLEVVEVLYLVLSEGGAAAQLAGIVAEAAVLCAERNVNVDVEHTVLGILVGRHDLLLRMEGVLGDGRIVNRRNELTGGADKSFFLKLENFFDPLAGLCHYFILMLYIKRIFHEFRR